MGRGVFPGLLLIDRVEQKYYNRTVAEDSLYCKWKSVLLPMPTSGSVFFFWVEEKSVLFVGGRG